MNRLAEALALVAIGFLIAALVTGCQTVRTSFRDIDGTTFTATTISAPFGKVDQSAHQLEYEWGGQNSIRVGQDAKGITGATIDPAILAGITNAVAGAVVQSLGAIFNGGQSEQEPDRESPSL